MLIAARIHIELKVDDVVLYFFSQLKRQNTKPDRSFEEAETPVWSLHLTNKAHAYPRSLPKQYISFCSFEVIQVL